MAAPGIIAGSLLVFLYSLDEFTGSLLIGAPFHITMPVFMYNAANGYEMQVASVTSVLLMVPGIVLLFSCSVSCVQNIWLHSGGSKMGITIQGLNKGYGKAGNHRY